MAFADDMILHRKPSRLQQINIYTHIYIKTSKFNVVTEHKKIYKNLFYFYTLPTHYLKEKIIFTIASILKNKIKQGGEKPVQ